MERMLFTESAILVQFQSVRRVLLILHRVVISLLAFAARERDFCSHLRNTSVNTFHKNGHARSFTRLIVLLSVVDRHFAWDKRREKQPERKVLFLGLQKNLYTQKKDFSSKQY